MAEFKRSYDESETMEGDYSMTEGTGLGTGFVGGLIVGGLAGWAFGKDRNYGYPYPYAQAPILVGNSCGCNDGNAYSLASVSNLVATKDAQYAQLNATQSSEFNILNTMSRDAATNAKEMCSLAYENSRLANQTQLEIANASAKADLCCCQTQGLINQSAAQTQGMISAIVPELKNFYLADEVEKLRIKSVKAENAYQFGALTTQLFNVGKVVDAVFEKVNTTTPTTSTATA